MESSMADHEFVAGLQLCDPIRFQPLLTLFLHGLEEEASMCLLALSLGGAVQLFD